MGNKSIGKNAIYSIIYKVLNVIFPLISTAYVSRVLLADGVGIVSAAQNNVSYFLILATLGIPVYGIREIAKIRDNNIEKNKVFSELFILNFIFTLVTYLFFNLIVFNGEFFHSEALLYQIFGFTILLNIFNVDWLFQGLEEYGYITVRSIIIKIISIILLLIFVKSKNDIYIYAILQVVAITGNYIFNIIRSRYVVNFSLKGINVKRHFKPLLYLALCSISTELYAKMDITMLDIMKSNDIVGYYVNSQKIINLIITTLVAVTAVFMPRLSFLFDKGKEEFNRILRLGFDLMVTISIPACIGIIFISEPLVITFLGDDFKKAAFTVSVLALMIPLKCIGDLICYQVMMCASQESLLMKSYFITMIVNIVNNIILIPRFGAEGAAFASVISEVLAFAFVLWFSRKYFYLNGFKTVITKTLICSAIMACSIIPFMVMKMTICIRLTTECFVSVFVYLICCRLIKHEVILKYLSLVKAKMKG